MAREGALYSDCLPVWMDSVTLLSADSLSLDGLCRGSVLAGTGERVRVCNESKGSCCWPRQQQGCGQVGSTFDSVRSRLERSKLAGGWNRRCAQYRSELGSRGSESLWTCAVVEFIFATGESLESCGQESDVIFKGSSLSKTNMHQPSDSTRRYLPQTNEEGMSSCKDPHGKMRRYLVGKSACSTSVSV